MAISKKCSKCKTRKLAEEFYPSSSKFGGLRSWCKECDKEDNAKREVNYKDKRKQYWEENREELNRKRRKKYHDKKN